MGKCSGFRVNLGMLPLKLIVSRKMSPVVMVPSQIYGVYKEIDGKTFIFRVKLGM